MSVEKHSGDDDCFVNWEGLGETGAPVKAASTPLVPSSTGLISVITTPLHGIFHAGAESGAQPLVRVGDRIQPGQLVGIVECMKMMNRIEAQQGGTVIQILVQDRQEVEKDQPLFQLRPV